MACRAEWKQNERLFWHWDIKFQKKTKCLVIKHVVYGFKKLTQSHVAHYNRVLRYVGDSINWKK